MAGGAGNPVVFSVYVEIDEISYICFGGGGVLRAWSNIPVGPCGVAVGIPRGRICCRPGWLGAWNRNGAQVLANHSTFDFHLKLSESCTTPRYFVSWPPRTTDHGPRTTIEGGGHVSFLVQPICNILSPFVFSKGASIGRTASLSFLRTPTPTPPNGHRVGPPLTAQVDVDVNSHVPHFYSVR